MKLIPWILVVLLSIMLMLSWCSCPADNYGKLAPDTLWTLSHPAWVCGLKQ